MMLESGIFQLLILSFSFFFFFLIFNVYLFLETESTRMSRGGAERESEAGSRLWAVSTEPDAEL